MQVGDRVQKTVHGLEAPSGASTKDKEQCANISRMKVQ